MYPASNVSNTYSARTDQPYYRDESYDSSRNHQRSYQQTYYPPMNFSDYGRGADNQNYYENRDYRPSQPPSRSAYYPPERPANTYHQPGYIPNEPSYGHSYDSRRPMGRQDKPFVPPPTNFPPPSRASSRNTHRTDRLDYPNHRVPIAPPQHFQPTQSVGAPSYSLDYAETNRMDHLSDRNYSERRFDSRREYPEDNTRPMQYTPLRKQEEFTSPRVYGNTSTTRSYLNLKRDPMPTQQEDLNLEAKALPGTFRQHTKQMESLLRNTSQLTIGEPDSKRVNDQEDRDLTLKPPKSNDKMSALLELQNVTNDIAQMILNKPDPVSRHEWTLLVKKVETQVVCLEKIIGTRINT